MEDTITGLFLKCEEIGYFLGYPNVECRSCPVMRDGQKAFEWEAVAKNTFGSINRVSKAPEYALTSLLKELKVIAQIRINNDSKNLEKIRKLVEESL